MKMILILSTSQPHSLFPQAMRMVQSLYQRIYRRRSDTCGRCAIRANTRLRPWGSHHPIWSRDGMERRETSWTNQPLCLCRSEWRARWCSTTARLLPFSYSLFLFFLRFLREAITDGEESIAAHRVCPRLGSALTCDLSQRSVLNIIKAPAFHNAGACRRQIY